MRETHPWWPSDHVINWSPVTNWELKISSSTRSITTKHDRLGTYGERKPPMESQDPLSTWWGIVIMWQTKSVTYPLWQDLWPWNLASWWLMVTWMRPWRHIFPWPPAHMRSRDKLRKRNISSSRRRMAIELCRVLTYAEAKPIMKLNDSDHMIKSGHLSHWKLNISSSARFVHPDLVGWWRMMTGSHSWGHMTLWIRSLAKSYKIFKTKI